MLKIILLSNKLHFYYFLTIIIYFKIILFNYVIAEINKTVFQATCH